MTAQSGRSMSRAGACGWSVCWSVSVRRGTRREQGRRSRGPRDHGGGEGELRPLLPGLYAGRRGCVAPDGAKGCGVHAGEVLIRGSRAGGLKFSEGLFMASSCPRCLATRKLLQPSYLERSCPVELGSWSSLAPC